MPGRWMRRLSKAARIAIILLPWLASMYAFYWLDTSGTWTRETPHRGKLSVLLLASGMTLSFLAYSLLYRHDSR